MLGSFNLSYAKPLQNNKGFFFFLVEKLQNNKLERKLSAYIEIESYIDHHCLAQRVRNYMGGVKWAEKLYVNHH